MNLTTLIVGAIGLAFGNLLLAEGFVAGINPSERPANAPQITSVKHGPEWYFQALYGVTEPYPPNLSFLDNQGNWSTPFNVPGMTGRYDIRGWYYK